jgi:hypothetical protein
MIIGYMVIKPFSYYDNYLKETRTYKEVTLEKKLNETYFQMSEGLTKLLNYVK